jgi:hypothetical protein
MGIVAMGAEKIGPFFCPEKIPGSFSVNPGLPVSKKIAMALTAESVAFIKVDEFTIKEPQLVPILCIMAIETPPHGLRMMQLDLGMLVL